MTLVAGVDSSTQSCKVAVCDAETGAVVRSGSAPHPRGTEVDPEQWWRALQSAITAAGGIDDVGAMSVAGQQHGMVCLDSSGGVVRDALLWNDTRSASSADDLVREFGGAHAWASEVGVVPVAALTVAKLRWLADREPDSADRTAAVCLPHDWLTWRLSDSTDIGMLTTDRSDASGTGYFSARDNRYRPDILTLALRGRTPLTPRVAAPGAVAATGPGGLALGAGAGDNAAAALGLGTRTGDLIVSLGTSGVVSAVTDRAPQDPDGLVAGFADATGRQLPLVCTLNGAPVLTAVADILGVDTAGFDRLALSAAPGADGLTLLPYLAGERSPNLPHATGSLLGMSASALTRANLARAAVEGVLASLVYCRERIEAQGVAVDRVLLTGGGSRSAAVAAIAPTLFGGSVTLPPSGEYVALGAARQAAWALTGELPDWSPSGDPDVRYGDPAPEVLQRYHSAMGHTLSRLIR